MSEPGEPPPPPPPGWPPSPPASAAGDGLPIDPWGAPTARFDTPPSNLPLAIAATVLGLCGLLGVIPGIVAIVLATQVKAHAGSGDLVAAAHNARQAKIWAFVSLGLTALLWLVTGVQGGLEEMNRVEEMNR